MKVINYEVSTVADCINGLEDSDAVYARTVVITYQDEFGRERAPITIVVDSNEYEEDILRRCEEAIAPRSAVRKVKDAVDAFFDVCK